MMVATKIEELTYEQCLEIMFYRNDRKKLSLNCAKTDALDNCKRI